MQRFEKLLSSWVVSDRYIHTNDYSIPFSLSPSFIKNFIIPRYSFFKRFLVGTTIPLDVLIYVNQIAVKLFWNLYHIITWLQLKNAEIYLCKWCMSMFAHLKEMCSRYIRYFQCYTVVKVVSSILAQQMGVLCYSFDHFLMKSFRAHVV